MDNDPLSDDTFAEIHRLVTMRQEGKLSPDDEASLDDLICQDPAALEVFTQYMLQTAHLRAWASAESGVQEAGDVAEEKSQTEPKQSEPKRTVPTLSVPLLNHLHPWTHPFRFTAVVFSLTLAFWSLFAWFLWPSSLDPNAPNPQPQIMCAVLTGMHKVDWAEGQGPLRSDTEIAEGQQIAIQSGLLEIQFSSGARLTVNGPARFQIQDRDSVAVDYGSFATRVPSEALGFRLTTPVTQVVDLGTEFGVKAEVNGSSLVHVFEGRVRLEHDNQNIDQHIELQTGESLRVNKDGTTTAVAVSAAGEFIRGLPQFAKKVSISNDAFEIPYAPDGDWVGEEIPHWRFSGGPGASHGTAAGLGYENLPRNCGRQYAFIVGSGHLTADVGSVEADSEYTLTVAIGNRSDNDPGSYRIHILVDDKIVASSVEIAADSIPDGQFCDASVSYTSDAEATGELATGELAVRLEHIGDKVGLQGNFAVVSLTRRSLSPQN